MAKRITIRFPPDRDADFYFRVFCWADDTLYSEIEQPGHGVIHDLDRVRDVDTIDVTRHRRVRRILNLIQQMLPRTSQTASRRSRPRRSRAPPPVVPSRS